VKETRLFLADVDYVSIGNANRARTITPSTVAVFLQINLWIVQAKSDGSEKPPLKIVCQIVCCTTAFFFCRRAAD